MAPEGTRRLGAVVLLWLLAGALGVSPTAAAGERGAYEGALLDAVLDREDLALAPARVGEEVAFVRIVRADVFGEDDFWPGFLNALHWTTRERVVRRELLIEEGDAYDQEKAEESERNLRGLGLFALVRVEPVVRAADGAFGLLAFTRDLWSLRLEQATNISGSLSDPTINQLLLQLTERNLFGLGKTAIVRFNLVPKTFSLGQVYIDPRLGGAALSFSESVDLYFARSGGGLEGVAGTASIGRPFYDLEQRWAWNFNAALQRRPIRRLAGHELRTWDDPETDDVETIGRIWDRDLLSLEASATVQLGGRYKHHLGAGAGFVRDVADPHAAFADDGQARRFRDAVLPRDRTDVFPFVTWRGFRATWSTLTDLGTFGRTEDVRTGPFWALTVSAPLAALGGDETSLRVSGNTGWSEAPGGGLWRLELSASGRASTDGVVDRALVASARGATPRMRAGRLVARLIWQGTSHDTQGTVVSLGSDNGLRGYPSGHFLVDSGNLGLLNLEYRTPPWVFRSAHIAGVVFYDAGTVYARTADLRIHQDAGVGLRWAFPQFTRFAWRFDLAMPFEGGVQVVFAFGSGQVIPLNDAELAAR